MDKRGFGTARSGVVRLDTARGHFPALHCRNDAGRNFRVFWAAEVVSARALEPNISRNRWRAAGRIGACAWRKVVAIHRTPNRRIVIGQALPACHDCDNGPARYFGRNCACGFERAGRKRFIKRGGAFRQGPPA
jgi:hypothetical protein